MLQIEDSYEVLIGNKNNEEYKVNIFIKGGYFHE